MLKRSLLLHLSTSPVELWLWDTMQSMRLVIGCFLVLGCSSIAMAAQSLPNGNEHEIRSVVADYMAARNGNSPEAVRRLFTPNADQLVSTGEWRRGITDLVRGTSLSSRKEAGNSSITVETVRLLDRDVAIVDGRYRTVSNNGTARDMWTTIILKHVGQDWRIAAIRNMLPAPASASHSSHGGGIKK